MSTPLGQRLITTASTPALPDFSAQAHLPSADVDAILLKQVQPLLSPEQSTASDQWQSQPATQPQEPSQIDRHVDGAPHTPALHSLSQRHSSRPSQPQSQRQSQRQSHRLMSAELAQAEETLMQPFEFVATPH